MSTNVCFFSQIVSIVALHVLKRQHRDASLFHTERCMFAFIFIPPPHDFKYKNMFYVNVYMQTMEKQHIGAQKRILCEWPLRVLKNTRYRVKDGGLNKCLFKVELFNLSASFLYCFVCAYMYMYYVQDEKYARCKLSFHTCSSSTFT